MAPLGYDKEAFANVIWKGTEAMYKNDGSKTNEEVFWDYFAKVFGEEKLKDKYDKNGHYSANFINGTTNAFMDSIKLLGVRCVSNRK